MNEPVKIGDLVRCVYNARDLERLKAINQPYRFEPISPPFLFKVQGYTPEGALHVTCHSPIPEQAKTNNWIPQDGVLTLHNWITA